MDNEMEIMLKLRTLLSTRINTTSLPWGEIFIWFSIEVPSFCSKVRPNASALLNACRREWHFISWHTVQWPQLLRSSLHTRCFDWAVIQLAMCHVQNLKFFNFPEGVEDDGENDGDDNGNDGGNDGNGNGNDRSEDEDSDRPGDGSKGSHSRWVRGWESGADAQEETLFGHKEIPRKKSHTFLQPDIMLGMLLATQMTDAL